MKKPGKENIEDIIALSPMQEGILFHYLKESESCHYFEQLSLRISGEIDNEFFEKAWNMVIRTNEMLRTLFLWDKVENPVQIILKEYKLQPEYYNLSDRNISEKKRCLEEIKVQDKKVKFDLREIALRVILCRIEDDEYEMIISNHHILYDGWSNGIILREFFNAYHALSNGKEWIKPVKTKYKEFIKWIQNLDANKQERFWRNYLRGFETAVELPVKRKKSKGIKEGGNYNIKLAGGLVDAVENFVRKRKVTLGSLLYSAWGILLQKYSESEDIIFGTTVSGRSAAIKGIENIVGLFINTLPLRIKSRPRETVSDLLYRVYSGLQEREKYENTSLADIKACVKADNTGELFDTIVVLENYPLENNWAGENSKLTVNSYSISESTGYDLTVSVSLFAGIEVDFIYNKDRLDRETVVRLSCHLTGLLEDMVNNPGKDVYRLDILTEEEKNEILYDFNDTGTDYPLNKTLQSLFEEQVEKTPGQIAIVHNHKQLTYEELNKKADRLACRLREKNVKPDIIVGLMVKRSLEMIIGIMGILKAGGVYLPIDPDSPQERIDFMLKDSNAEILLSEVSGLSKIINKNEGSLTHPTHLCYIIYTSGSTGRPKGVMVEHRGVVNYSKWAEKTYLQGKSGDFPLYSSLSFDLTVTSVFVPLLSGNKIVIYDDTDNETAVARIFRENRVRVVKLTPSHLKIVKELDIGAGDIEVLIVGGEDLPARLAYEVYKKFNKNLEIYNEYGPTETVVGCMIYKFDPRVDKGDSVPIGRPAANTGIYLLDRHKEPVPPGVPGEIYISGAGVARGYLNSPELTTEKFISISYKSYRSYRTYSSKKIYKTGDLARWLPGGDLEFVGRRDHQVKIRGYRVELGEIENRLCGHEDIKAAVVVDWENEDGEKYLCGYMVSDRKLEQADIEQYLAKELPRYMIPSHFVELERIPLTVSGKVDRKALPKTGVVWGQEKEFTAPGDEIERKLVEIWSGVLYGKKASPVSIGIDDNFFQLGGHSLKATILMSRIHKALDVKVPLTEMFEKPTIRDMAAFIRSAVADRYASIGLTEEKDYYVLSPAQERLYILRQMDENSTGYNVSAVLELEGDIEADRLKGTFIKLIRRHESLRTSFHMAADRPVQRIHDEVEFKIEYYSADIIRDFFRPFDLSKAPLLRVGLMETGNRGQILVLDMHHIVSDAVSTEVFIKDFAAMYAGEELPDLKLRYKDYSEWQDRSKEKEAIKKQEEYWLNQFAEGVSVLDLPADYKRPAVQGFAGRTVHFETGIKETKALRKMVSGGGESLTMFMVLAAVYAVFLSKIGGSRDIVIGIPAAGRRHADLEQIIGVFVNTLPLRISLAGEQTLTALLNQVKERTLGAFDNQEYQYEDLVEKVVVNRDVSRNPLFDVMLVMQDIDISRVEIPGLKLKPYEYEDRTSKFDLTLLGVEAGGRLSFGFEYSTRLFKKETIARFVRYFNKIVTAVVLGDRGQRISAIEIISQEEKQQILFDFNDTYCAYPQDKTIHELFAEQAARIPDRAAVIGITSVTYAELNRKSDRLAYFLKEKGVKADTIVGIMTERSVEMVIGILGILKAGGAYLPIDPDYPEERINYMLNDSGTEILLTSSDLFNCQLSIVNNQLLMNSQPATKLAYIIYTSGSTGKPKGVMTEHRALVNRLNWMQKAYPIGEGDVILQKTPFIFDVSVWELFWWSIEGASLCLLEPGGEKSPEAIVEAVEKHKITAMHFVPSMLSVLLEYLECQGYKRKFSSLRQVFSSGEALTVRHVERFRNVLAETLPIRLINLYGPTEAAIDVSYFNCDMEDIPGCIPIGRPIDNIRLIVVSKDMHVQPVGIAGELCIGGEGLARGYLNRPELTAEKFLFISYKSYRTYNSEKIYKTGDLARWLWDGNIEFLGRIDFQVKIRGFRIELGEIESRLLGHENIKEAVVLARGDGSGDHTIVAYIVAGRRLPATGLREYLSMELPDYMIPSYFVQLEKMPVTPNGKLDRNALPEPETRAGEEYSYSAPGNRMEEKLALMWAEVLQVPVGIGIDDNFFHLGGHSLKAAVLVSRVHKEFNVRVPLAEMFKKPTIRGLSAYIKGAAEDKCQSIKPVEKKDYYALSSAQKRLFILQQMHKEGTGYNMVSAAVLEGAVEKDRVQDLFIRLIMRHESLRTSFTMIEDQPVQKIHEEENSRFQITTIMQDFVRPFELSKPPLLRVGLIETGSGKYILMVDMHHIISDGISLEIFLTEFMAVYAGEKLPAVELQYKDYSEWQDSGIEREEVMKQGEYWRKQFETGIPVLDLPTDYVRPAIWGFKGNRIHFEISSEQTAALSRLALREGGTLYMVLLAAYNIFLAKVSNREDIVVGTPAAGRNHMDLEQIIGVFVNTLALRNYPAGEKTFIEFLRQVKGRTLEAFENQEYQYEELVEKTAVNRNVSRNPLFDVMFVMQEMNAYGVEVHGLKLIPFNYEKDTALFDLILYVEPEKNLRFAFEYSAELFKKKKVERFTGYFKKILLKAVENPGIKISEIEIISPEEKKNLLFDFNDEIVEYPKDKTIHRLFEEQAERTPDNTAVVYEDGQISYKELDRRANRLAQYLKQKGVGSEIIVGLKVKRSIEMITGIIGILKAGGAYLPIDPDYPEERINYMLKDSGTEILLTSADLSNCQLSMNSQPAASLAYIIYTSGTTGKPKGVMINQRNVVRLLINDKILFDFNENDVWTMFHSYCFDFSVWEMYGALLYGGKLVVVPRMVARDPGLFLGVLRKHDVTVLNQTPSAFYHLLDEELKSPPGKELNIKYIIFGGEALKPVKLKEWQKKYPGTKLVNMFGITETTVHVTYKEITPLEIEINSRSIGKQIPTSSLYILDRDMRLLPMGVPGELCVGGEGVGRGYLNRPELTADKFIENPYKPGDVFYRTGDLVRFIGNGEMEYLGRIDHQVQVRGFRVEPGEIESQLLKQRGIKEAVVIDGEDKAGEIYLCAYITADEEMDIFKLRTILAKSLPGYMIPSYFMQVDHIPLTPNGKVDRRALPAPGANAGKEYIAPGNEKEKKLAEIWSEVLLLVQGSIGIDDDFFELGGHSLKAAALAAKIHKEFDVKVPLVEIFKTPTIRGLCTYIKGAAESRYVSIPLAEKREYHSLSPAQKRLYILYQMEEGKSIVYNIPQIITMDAGIDRQKLEQAFKTLIQRHESLRTSFHMAVNQPVQCIHDEVEFEIEQHTPAFIRPFDLSKAPLFRVGLIEVKNGMHLLVVDMHHIVSDGVSMQLLVADFTALCKGEKLPLLRIQYKDYALWQNREIERGAVKNQEEYWMNEFEGEIPVTDLPLDYPRPAVQSFAGSSIDLTIDSSETEGLRKLAKSGGVTLYMMLLAMFNVFTAKLSGNEDIVMGTPAAGRRHADLEPVIGMFVNTLPLRNFPSAQKPFNGFLYEVKEKTLKAFENQDYPFEELVENVSTARDISRNPLFDIMFNLQNQAEHTTNFPGKESYAYESRVSKFDMTLAGVEIGDELHFSLEYCTTLFKRETIERFIKYFKTMVSWILANPSGKIADIEIVSEEEKQWILYDFNHTEAVYPAEKTIHELFEEQAARTPRHIAVKGTRELHEISITYSELNRKSNQFAGVLREKGVLADDIVGIMMKPSIEMIIGIMGILKAGGAYLPIDPDYPRERIDYMLKDSNARVLVKSVGNRLACSDSQSSPPSKPSGLAYIIYTSGSTGQPKGVMVNHQPVINLLFYLDKEYPFGETDTYLLKTSYIFDVSVTELFGWFLNGGRLVVLPGGDEKDPRKILEAIVRCHVTHINFVPSMFNAFVETLHTEAESIDFLSSLKYIFLAGEALKPEVVNRFRRIHSQIPLENLYGPTEAVVYASRYSLSDWSSNSDIPIGRPIQNVRMLILDRSHHFQPVGVTGELCIGGEGLARGYLNRPELTAEKFFFFSYKSYRTYRTYRTYISEKIYKSGDLARWLSDGNIEFLGRMDYQVKIRGYRIELEEIEKQLLRHESIIEAVVLEKGEDNDKYICAYIVPAADREPQVLELRKHLVRILPDYMIPAHFVQIENIPLTPSGKIDRKALPAPEIKAGEDYTAPGNETEKKLAEIWSDVLNLETGIIGIDANFFQLGGHSLKAAVLVSRIQERFNLRVPLAKIFKVPTVRGLAEYIEGALENEYAPLESIVPLEEKEYYELSSAQKRIYFFQRLDAGGTSHNMPAIIVLEGVMDKDRLEEVIGKLIDRHESFRTSFVKVDGNPMQKVHGRVEFEIEYRNGSVHGRVEDIIADFVRPFDLSQAPLLRVGLIKTGEKRHTLLIDMHHIITDGTSTGLFIKDFTLFYEKKELPEPVLRYKDFSKWQNNRIFSKEIKDQEEYWLKEFEDELPGLSIPTDYPRPPFQSFAGDLITFEIDNKTVEHLKRLAEETGTTMFMVLFAAYNVLLFKYTGQEDVVVGSPTAGREHPALQDIIGMFANILALRNYPRPWKTFKDFLESVKENSLKAFENRDYPFEMLVDKLDFKRDSGRSPLFDTVFAFRDMFIPRIQIKDLKLVICEPEHKTTHWDLLLEVQEKDEKNGPLGFSLEYSIQLFKKETIESLGKHFINILNTAAANPGIKLSDVDMLSEMEKEKIWEFSRLNEGGDYDFE